MVHIGRQTIEMDDRALEHLLDEVVRIEARATELAREVPQEHVVLAAELFQASLPSRVIQG